MAANSSTSARTATDCRVGTGTEAFVLLKKSGKPVKGISKLLDPKEKSSLFPIPPLLLFDDSNDDNRLLLSNGALLDVWKKSGKLLPIHERMGRRIKKIIR